MTVLFNPDSSWAEWGTTEQGDPDLLDLDPVSLGMFESEPAQTPPLMTLEEMTAQGFEAPAVSPTQGRTLTQQMAEMQSFTRDAPGMLPRPPIRLDSPTFQAVSQEYAQPESGAGFGTLQLAPNVERALRNLDEMLSFVPFAEGQAGQHPGIVTPRGGGADPSRGQRAEERLGTREIALPNLAVRDTGRHFLQTPIPDVIREPFVELFRGIGSVAGEAVERTVDTAQFGPAAVLEAASDISQLAGGPDLNPIPSPLGATASVINDQTGAADRTGVDLTGIDPNEIGADIGEMLVPREVWELAIELVPGVGVVPGVASMLIKSRLGQLVAQRGIAAVTREAVETIVREVGAYTPEIMARQVRSVLGRQNIDDLARVLSEGSQGTQLGAIFGPGMAPRQAVEAGAPSPTPKRIAGRPPGIQTDQQVEALTQRLTNIASTVGKVTADKARFWYETSGGFIRAMAQGDLVKAERAARLWAWGSTDTSVKGQGVFFLRAWKQLVDGVPVTSGHRYGAINKTIREVMDMNQDDWVRTIEGFLVGEGGQKQKLANFYTDLLDEVDPALARRIRMETGVTSTNDRWMNRAFGFPQDSRTPAQYAFMSDITREVAERLGWTPKQVQAAIWVNEKGVVTGRKVAGAQASKVARETAQQAGTKGKRELDEIGERAYREAFESYSDDIAPEGFLRDEAFDYEDSLRRHMAQVSWESAPGGGTPRASKLAEYGSQSMPEKMRFHRAIQQALSDDEGFDILARELGLPTDGLFDGPGIYLSGVSPGSQRRVFVGSEVGLNVALDAGQRQVVDDYVAALSYLLDQEAGAWTRPIADMPSVSHNGVTVSLGRTITDDEGLRLAQVLGDDFAILPSEDGAWIFGLPGDDHFEFFDIVRSRQFVNDQGKVGMTKLKAAHGDLVKRLEATNGAHRLQVEEALDEVFPGVNIEASTFASDGNYISSGGSRAGYLEGRSALRRPNVRKALDELQGRIDAVDDEFETAWRTQRLQREAAGQPVGSVAFSQGPGGRPPLGEEPIPRAPPSTPPEQINDAAAEFAGNIRLSKFPDDVQDIIQDTIRNDPAAVAAARRGVVPDEEVERLAQELVDEVGGDFNKFAKKWKPGEAMNAEEVQAVRMALRSKTEEVIDLAAVARQENSASNHVKLLQAMEEQARIQEVVHGITAEAGRTLRAFRTAATKAREQDDAAQALERLLHRVGRERMDEVAHAISLMDDVNDPFAMNQLLRDLVKPELKDYITEIWINSILSGPKTHIINFLSNSVNAMMSPVERGLAAGVENVVARVQGRPVERFFSEMGADVFGLMQGLPEGVRGALSVLKHGFNPSDIGKVEFRTPAFKGRAGRVIRFPTTMLEAGDALGQAVNYRAGLSALAARQAGKEGLKGEARLARIAELVSSPPARMAREAAENAEYRLFRAPPGKLTAGITGIREALVLRVPGTKLSVAPLRFVVPFLNTPTNVIKFGIERSPLGLLNESLWLNLQKGSPEASDQIARILMGSSIAGAFGALVASDQIDFTLGVPTDAAERDAFFRQGKVPFGIRIGNTWIQYQRLEPWNQTMTQMASVIDAIRRGDPPDAAAAQVVSTIVQNLSDQSYMSGISDLMDATNDPARYAARYLRRQAAGLVPYSSLGRTIAQAIDPTVREVDSFSDQIKANTPFLSQDLPSRLTALGTDARRQSPPWSPIQVTQQTDDPVERELERLGVKVTFVGRTIGGVALTEEEQRTYQILAGQITYEVMRSLIASPQWRTMSDIEKAIALNKAKDESRAAAREALAADLEAAGR